MPGEASSADISSGWWVGDVAPRGGGSHKNDGWFLILYCCGVRGVTWAVSELEEDNGGPRSGVLIPPQTSTSNGWIFSRLSGQIFPLGDPLSAAGTF